MYLIDVEDQHRESEAIRRLVLTPPLLERILYPFGFGSLCWIFVEVQKPRVVPNMQGDVDILIGPLEWKEPAAFDSALRKHLAQLPGAHPTWPESLAAREVAASGGIKWPPDPHNLVGFEVKCAYFERGIRSAKSSPQKTAGIRKQIKWLFKMGIERVALLDVIANPPGTGQGSDAWIAAMVQGDSSLRAMNRTLNERLPKNSLAGHFVWAVGPVTGGDETVRGAGAPIQIRGASVCIPQEPRALANRKILLERLPQLLNAFPVPRTFPACFIDCRKCGRPHNLSGLRCT